MTITFSRDLHVGSSIFFNLFAPAAAFLLWVCEGGAFRALRIGGSGVPGGYAADAAPRRRLDIESDEFVMA